MNIDFHYYATYLAARVAKFSHEDAKVIAHAAQYVDDSVSARIERNLLQGLPRITPTTETNFEIAGKNIVCTQSNIQESEQIWAAFHFLPGNMHPKDHKEEYTEKKSWGKGFLQYAYGAEQERAFSMMCLPNSVLSQEMIRDTLNYKKQSCYLEMVGIRMHVLADTWAHCYFAGTPSWWVNEAPRDIYYEGGDKDGRRVPFIQAKKFSDLSLEAPFVTTPPAFAFNSYAYLGHGRMGHVPDVPYMRYRYIPKWTNREVIKDNVADYIKAFRQMVRAMRCIEGGQVYDRDTGDEKDSGGGVDKTMVADLQKIFEEKDYKASEAARLWLPVIMKYYPDAKGQLEYNPDQWMEDAKKERNQKGHYYQFNYAAVMHLEFVEKYIMDLAKITKEADGALEETSDQPMKWILVERAADKTSYRCCMGIRYCSHDGSKWFARVQDGRFVLHPNGQKDTAHTGNYIDYISDTGQKLRADFREGILIHSPAGAEGESYASSSIGYTDWDGKACEAHFVQWDNPVTPVDLEMLDQEKIKIFGIGTELGGWVRTISTQVEYSYPKDQEWKKGVFEYQKTNEGGWKFCLTEQDSQAVNLLRDELEYADENEKVHSLKIEEGMFVIDGTERSPSVMLRGWGGNKVEIVITDWEKMNEA